MNSINFYNLLYLSEKLRLSRTTMEPEVLKRSYSGAFVINAYFSPALNLFRDENGLQYAMSVDNEQPQTLSLNKEDKTSDQGVWTKWVPENISIKSTTHKLIRSGKHTVKFWMVTPGVVLQKLVLDFGGLEQTYLGQDETTERIPNNLNTCHSASSL